MKWLLRIYNRRIVAPARRKAGWEPTDTGELKAHLHPRARTTRLLPAVPPKEGREK